MTFDYVYLRELTVGVQLKVMYKKCVIATSFRFKFTKGRVYFTRMKKGRKEEKFVQLTPHYWKGTPAYCPVTVSQWRF